MNNSGGLSFLSVKHLDNAGMVALVALLAAPQYLNGLYNPLLENNPFYFYLCDAAGFIFLPLVTYLFFLRQRKIIPRKLGIHFDYAGKRDEAAVVWLSIILFFVIFIYECIVSGVIYSLIDCKLLHHGFEYRQMVPSFGVTRWLAIIYMAATAGIFEELLYRGAMRRLFGKSGLGCVLYVFFSSLFFSGAHWEFGVAHMLVVFFLGVAFAGLYLLFENLTPLIVVHMALDVYWLS